MKYINQTILDQLNLPAKESHKGENGRLTIIGGSKLFHGSPLLGLQVASQIVDMLYFVSIEENLKLLKNLKSNLYSFIAVPFGKETDYIKQSDAILIGPGMVRGDKNYTGTGESGMQTQEKVLSLLKQYPNKKWVLDAGALQTITIKQVYNLGAQNIIVTPHRKEFVSYFNAENVNQEVWDNLEKTAQLVWEKAQEFGCTIILKGKIDIISNGQQTLFNQTGNEGMTKGGTGDVLAGLVSALACTNDLLTSASIAAFINGLTGDELYKTVGPFFNADQLAQKVPEVLWEQINKIKE